MSYAEGYRVYEQKSVMCDKNLFRKWIMLYNIH